MTRKTSPFDHPLISSRYFFPRYERPRDVVPVTVGDAVLGCSRHITHPDAPWIVHFHGNGEVVADYESDLAALFQAVGFNVLIVDRTHAERNALWAKQSELVLYKHGDHNDVLSLNVTDIVKRVSQLGMGSS